MDLELLKSKCDECLHELGYYLYQIKTSKDKSGLTISLIIDDINDKTISMNDIVSVSNILNELFDKIDMFDCAYTLDISSLGAEKPIKIENLDRYINKYICLHLNNPFKGENILYGDLSEVCDDYIMLTYKVKTRKVEAKIDKTNIVKARKAIKF